TCVGGPVASRILGRCGLGHRVRLSLRNRDSWPQGFLRELAIGKSTIGSDVCSFPRGAPSLPVIPRADSRLGLACAFAGWLRYCALALFVDALTSGNRRICSSQGPPLQPGDSSVATGSLEISPHWNHVDHDDYGLLLRGYCLYSDLREHRTSPSRKGQSDRYSMRWLVESILAASDGCAFGQGWPPPAVACVYLLDADQLLPSLIVACSDAVVFSHADGRTLVFVPVWELQRCNGCLFY